MARPVSSQDEISHPGFMGHTEMPGWEVRYSCVGYPPQPGRGTSTQTHAVRLRASGALQDHGNAAPRFWGPLLSTATSTSWEGGTVKDRRACWGDEPRGFSVGCRAHSRGGTGGGFLPHAGVSPHRVQGGLRRMGSNEGPGTPTSISAAQHIAGSQDREIPPPRPPPVWQPQGRGVAQQ